MPKETRHYHLPSVHTYTSFRVTAEMVGAGKGRTGKERLTLSNVGRAGSDNTSCVFHEDLRFVIRASERSNGWVLRS